MPITDDHTPNLNLPLPYVDNMLEDDSDRIRSALTLIDTAVAGKASNASVVAVNTALASKADLVGGKIPSDQLPGFVDDVVEVTNFAALPTTGESGKIYVLFTPYTVGGYTCTQFRWGGSAYVPIPNSPGSTDVVPEGATNQYFTPARAAAAVPIASSTTLGKVKIGAGLGIDGEGLLFASAGGGSVLTITEVVPGSDGVSSITVPGGYLPGAILVAFNGSLLAPSDFVATSGTSVGLVGFAAGTADTFTIISLATVSIGALPAGSVGTAQLANGAVTTPKLTDGAVTPVKTTGLATTGLGAFFKPDTQSVAFVKTGASTASIKAGVVVDVFGLEIRFSTNTAIVMPALIAGTDYAIYACQDGSVRADSSFTAPSGYTAANSRLIGGFHYGLTAPGTTLASGSFNTAGSVQTGGMVWTQADVDKIAGINQFSLWDLKWRANVSDLRAQRGFVLTDAGTWVAIYFASTLTDANGLSKYNTDVASGTVLPKIPATMGGNGVLTYADYNWWRASEHARAYGARLLTEAEANIAFFGVTENQSLGGAASTIPLTTRQAGYTSKYGVEQATGHHRTWGNDSSGTAASAYVATGGRGQAYANNITKVLLGGVRDYAETSGSRASFWAVGLTYSYWGVGLRAACDHLMLV